VPRRGIVWAGGPAEEGRFFHEVFTGTDSWILVDERAEMVAEGRHAVVAFVPTGEPGKLWLALGDREEFGAADLARFHGWRVAVRRFHEAATSGTLLGMLRDLAMAVLRAVVTALMGG